jgi:hypothetical protein
VAIAATAAVVASTISVMAGTATSGLNSNGQHFRFRQTYGVPAMGWRQASPRFVYFG